MQKHIQRAYFTVFHGQRAMSVLPLQLHSPLYATSYKQGLEPE